MPATSTCVGSESLAPAEIQAQIAKSNPSFRPSNAPKWLLWLAAGVMLVSGTYDSIASKWMNKQNLPPCRGCAPRYFEGAFFQTLTMYLGETLCLVVYYADHFMAKRGGRARKLDFPTSAASFNKKKCPIYWWIIPTTLDFCGSSMINYALIFSQASTVQMLRNFNVILTAALTMIYIKMGLRVHQWMGVIVLTLGLALVGLYAFLNPDTDTNHKDLQWLGVVMALCGTCLAAFQFVFEESLFRKYYASPFEAVGWMGFYGTVASIVVLIIGQYAGFEDTKGNLYMMGLGVTGSTYLILANLSFILSILFFNSFGLMVTKLGSGLLRAVMFSTRTFTVWAMELILKWNTFDGLNFCGLLVIIGGALLYNYNQLGRDGCCPCDKTMRKPLICCGVRNPDVIANQIAEMDRDETSTVETHDRSEEANIAKLEEK